MGSIGETGGKVVNTNLNYYLDPAKGGHTSYQVGVSRYRSQEVAMYHGLTLKI